MAELVYSAGLTSKLFWLQESRKTAFDIKLFIGNSKGIPFGNGEVCFRIVGNTVTGKAKV